MIPSVRMEWKGLRGVLENAALIIGPMSGLPKRRTQEYVFNYYNQKFALDMEKLRDRYLAPRLAVVQDRFVRVSSFELDSLQIGEHYRAIRGQYPDGKDPQRVLEVGAGYGRTLFPLSRAFPNAEFWGLEYSNAGPRNARTYEGCMTSEIDAIAARLAPLRKKDRLAADFRSGDARKLPYEDKSFDVAYTNLVLEQIPSPEDHDRVFREIRRVTRGLCCFLEPWGDAQTWLTMPYLRHVDYFRQSYRKLDTLGYKDVRFRRLHFSGNPRFNYGFVTAVPGD